MAIQELMKIKEDQEQEKENPKKKNQTLNTRCKEVEFRLEVKRWIMSYMKMDLADYIGDYPFEMAKTGFEKQYLPKWKMKKKIVIPPTSMLKMWRGNKWS